MKYTIKHRCGHEAKVELFGAGRERDRKIAWMSSQVCFECRKAQEAAAGHEAEVANGWPALQGTEKQVNWAVSIRKKLADEWRTYVLKQDAPNAEKQIAIKCFDLIIGKHPEAAWWIENRDSSPQTLIRLAAAKSGAKSWREIYEFLKS